MLKRDELSNPASCLHRAHDDELIFVLLARDAAAPEAIRAWVRERLKLGKNQPTDPQITEALQCATLMEQNKPLGPLYPEGPKSLYEVNNEALEKGGQK